jgi:hypothetical protein
MGKPQFLGRRAATLSDLLKKPQSTMRMMIGASVKCARRAVILMIES